MKSLKTKIILMILLSALTVSSIVAIVLLNNSYDAYKKESIDKLKQMTYYKASEFNRDLNDVEKLATSVELLVSAMFSFDALNENKNYMNEFKTVIKPVIKRIAEQGSMTQSAYVFFLPSLDGSAHDVWYSDLNDDGFVVLQEEFELSYYDDYIPGREWFFEPYRTEKSYWTDPYAGNADYDEHIIYVSHTRPVFVDGKIIGISGSDYHFNVLKEDISNIKIYDTGYAFLLNEEGYILCHDNLPEMSSLLDYGDGSYSWIHEKLISESTGAISYKWIDGQDKIMTYKHLSNGWIFGVSVKVEEVFSWYEELKIFLVVLISISLLLISLLAYRMGRYITRDLEALKDHVQVIGAGNYDHELTSRLLSKKDETGILAASIEQMRLKQKESFIKIHEANDALESKIIIRTAALQEKTEALLISLRDNEAQNFQLSALNEELGLSITTMKEAQKQLIESEKLASLGFLVSRLSHEFNTPIGSLTTVGTYIIQKKKRLEELYKDKKLKEDDLKKYFNSFDEASRLVMDNIAQLNNLVKRFKELDPDTIMGHYSKVNMKMFFEVVLESMNIEVEGIHLELICDATLTVTIDQGKLAQVFIHLIENAYKHAFKEFDQGLIVVEIIKDHNYLLIEVKDNGCGLSDEVLKHIFVPFYSEQLSKNSNGLGLSVIYNIVTKIFKGSIECKSDLNLGTSFAIRLLLEDEDDNLF